MIDIKICPVCGGENLQHLLLSKDNTVSHKTFEVRQCQTCKLGITTPRPADKDLHQYYVSDDYISHSNKGKTLVDKVYLIARSFTLKWKLKIIQQTSTTPGKILDYGCGTGEFLSTCRNAGWTTVGVEPSSTAREQAKQLTNSSIYESLQSVTDYKFNVITLWHVLEHVGDLDQTLSLLKSKLDENGTIFIAVPNHSSWDGQHYKEHWAGYDTPRHLWHFSRETMKVLINKNGMKVTGTIPMKLDSFYISLLSEKYKNNKSSITGMLKATLNGLTSNVKAYKSGDYSSLIYIVRK
jgi:2-polyprenyl-3-methyl-5-hydroxy-6-metoxy-1,4-benzoquinol methylase